MDLFETFSLNDLLITRQMTDFSTLSQTTPREIPTLLYAQIGKRNLSWTKPPHKGLFAPQINPKSFSGYFHFLLNICVSVFGPREPATGSAGEFPMVNKQFLYKTTIILYTEAHTTNSAVWPVPSAYTQPYHPRSGSHGQLFCPC